MRRGFTLIELTIVLVVVGLLIGGILVARSMIETAKITSFVRFMGQTESAVANFKTKFNCLPGDDNHLTNPGNCDGAITRANNGGNDYFTDEIANFWPHLGISGYMDSSNFSNTVATGKNAGIEIGDNMPIVSIGTNCGMLASSRIPPLGATIFGYGTNMYLVGGFVYNGVIAVQNNNSTCLESVTSLAVDTKIDDGKPQTGNVRASRGYIDMGTAYAPAACSSATAYNTSSAGPNCNLAILVGITTGY